MEPLSWHLASGWVCDVQILGGRPPTRPAIKVAALPSVALVLTDTMGVPVWAWFDGQGRVRICTVQIRAVRNGGRCL